MILFRIIFNLFGMVTRLIFLPLHLIMHNLYLVIILLAVVIVYHAFSGGTNSTTNSGAMIQPAPDPRVANPASKPGMIDAVRRREDGDSAFSTDLYASMTDPERNYYSSMFYSVMENVPDGQAYVWNNANIQGSITPTRTFLTNGGYNCRDFKEVLKVHSIEQTISGTACPRSESGWCKLKPNATPACGLHTQGGGILSGLKGLF